MAYEGGTQRNHIGCVACGARWVEKDAALVQRVGGDQMCRHCGARRGQG